MNKKVVLILVVTAAAGACCFSGAALVLFGADSVGSTTPTRPQGEAAKLSGTWLLSYPTMKTWRALRDGEALRATSLTNGGGVIELHDDGSCLRDTLVTANVLGCTTGAYIRYEDCTWTLDGDVLSLALDDGTIRSTTCDQSTETTKEAKARTERGRVALQVEAGVESLSFTDLETGTATTYRRSAD